MYVDKDKAKLIERVSARFYESIDKLNEDISKLKTKTGKEELLIQKAYEEYSLGKIDREEYSLKREIALSHIATINNEVISVEKVVKDLEYIEGDRLKFGFKVTLLAIYI